MLRDLPNGFTCLKDKDNNKRRAQQMMYFLEKISYLPLTPSSQEIVLNDTVSSTILTTDVMDIVYFHLNSQLECINCSQNDTDIVYSNGKLCFKFYFTL